MMLHVVNAKYRFIDGGLSREKMDFPCIYKTNLQQSLRFLGKPEMRFFCYVLCVHVNIPQKKHRIVRNTRKHDSRGQGSANMYAAHLHRKGDILNLI